MVLMPLAQFKKSTACIPSTLISTTRLMWPWRKLLFWAIAVPIEQIATSESKASVFFIVTSSHDGKQGHVTGMLRTVELFVKNECGDVENGISNGPSFVPMSRPRVRVMSGGSRSQRISILAVWSATFNLSYF